MNEAELNEILKKIESELTGDPDHDADVWNEWGERYRDVPGAEPLLSKIAHKLFDLMVDEDPEMPQAVFDDMVETADEDFEEACRLIEQERYEEAAAKLGVLTEVIAAYSLPEDTVWMDFAGYLDAMIYQDYYDEYIGEREIGRHPMHPAKILYTYGSLLIEMGRADEAVRPLEMLLSFDPVSPKYLFEMSEAYKRTGQIQEAYDTSLWALSCAASKEELARAYRDLAYCLSESGAFEDAAMLYMLSLRYQSSRQADAEIIWIRKKTGISPEQFTNERIDQRCAELHIPVGPNETVVSNLRLLDLLSGDGEDEADED